MFFIILGTVIFVGLFLTNSLNVRPEISKFKSGLRYISIAFIVIGFLAKCFIQIEAGFIGVKTLFGKVENDVIYPGLHFVNPLIQIIELESRTQNYTMSGINDEGQKSGDDAIRVLTKDGLEVVLDITVLFKINEGSAPKLVNEVGVDYQEKIIRPISRSRIRDYAVYYEAVDLYSRKREEFQSNISKSIEADFTSRGLILEQILIRNIALPQNVKNAIEEKIKAEQESQKMQFVLQKEKQEADRKRLEAQGIADYQKIINTGLTDNQLEYERIKAMKELSLSQNAKVIVTGSKSTPLIINGN